MGLEFAILYKGETEKGRKTVKTMMAWPQETVLQVLKKNFKIHRDIDKALEVSIKEFKRKSVKIP